MSESERKKIGPYPCPGRVKMEILDHIFNGWAFRGHDRDHVIKDEELERDGDYYFAYVTRPATEEDDDDERADNHDEAD